MGLILALKMKHKFTHIIILSLSIREGEISKCLSVFALQSLVNMKTQPQHQFVSLSGWVLKCVIITVGANPLPDCLRLHCLGHPATYKATNLLQTFNRFRLLHPHISQRPGPSCCLCWPGICSCLCNRSQSSHTQLMCSCGHMSWSSCHFNLHVE